MIPRCLRSLHIREGPTPGPTLSPRSLHVRVGATLRPALDDADEAAVVNEAFLGPAGELLFLLGLSHLRCLVLDLPSARQRSVHFAHGCNFECSRGGFGAGVGG